MFFGKEGLLYISLGDEGGSNDEFDNAQHIDKALFGGIIRIDVDKDLSKSHVIRRFPEIPLNKPEGWPENINNYLIPNDNPWLDPEGGILEEFYSIGMRSPHRMSLDTLTNTIWVGDVGQVSNEEITIITKGSNAQWPYMEGVVDGPKPKPDVIIGIETPPIHTFCCTRGNAVIGGFVYRGGRFPTLKGRYIFGDFGTGRIWTLDPETKGVELLLTLPGGQGVVDFATDRNGEIYMVKLTGETGIWKLVEDIQSPEPPRLLSETGAFSDLSMLKPSEGLIGYEVNTPLWSDRATKKRWISIPSDQKIVFSSDSSWTFPKGTVFVKHFEVPTDQAQTVFKRIETRFLVADINGGYYGITYEWNDEQTEAILVSDSSTVTRNIEYINDNGVVSMQTWRFPSRSQCLSCHNANAGHILGVKTSQLNKTLNQSEERNQIEYWNDMGFFSNSLDNSAIQHMNKLTDLSSTNCLEIKVRSYLDANCSHCHRPGGVEGAFDARITTPLGDQRMIDQPVESRNSDPANKIVSPKNLGLSELYIRDTSVTSNAMPPLAKSLVDKEYVKILSEWIVSLDTIPVEEEDSVNIVEEDSVIIEDPDTITLVTHINTIYNQEQLLKVYPNPFRSQLEVSLEKLDPQHKLDIVIYNSVGIIVYDRRGLKSEEKITISNRWPPGIYFISISSLSFKQLYKLMRI